MTTATQTTSTIGSESGNTMDVKALLREIDLSNNGYLFSCTSSVLLTASMNPALFKVSNGLIYKVGTSPAQYEGAPTPRQVADETDYETLIFNQQSALTRNF